MMVQLLLLHLALLGRCSQTLNWLSWRGSVRLGLPLWFYDKGTLLLVCGVLSVAVCWLVLDYIRYTAFRRKCLGAAEEVRDGQIVRLYWQAVWEAGLDADRVGKMYVCDGMSSPFVMGFRQPILFAPREALREDGYLMFLHECVHMKHRDTQYKLFLLVMNRLLWFQPLAYLARHLGFRDVEVDCDETVVEGKSEEERLSYGQFLIDSLRRAKEQEAYSTFFLSSAAIMKARIQAVTENRQNTDAAAKAAVGLLVLETCLFGGWLIKGAVSAYMEATAPFNIYEGYELPEHFTEQALNEMLTLESAAQETYYRQIQAQEGSVVESYEELSVQAEGPWQIRLKDTVRYADCLLPLLERYLCYFGRQEWESERDYEQLGYSSLLEGVYTRLMAGDGQEAVFAVICREYLLESQQSEEILAEAEDSEWIQLAQEGETRYAYYSVALHIERKEEHVYELVGLTSLDEAAAAFAKHYPEEDYSDIPDLQLRYAADAGENGAPGTAAAGAGSVGEGGQTPDAEADTTGTDITGTNTAETGTDGGQDWEISLEEGWLRIREGEGEWKQAPVSSEELFDRGDQMDGALTSLQEGSYQCDGRKQIFAYGGAYDYEAQTPVPVRVTWYDEAEDGWKESVVTSEYTSVRRLFISFPENSLEGFLILTCERTMWQEGNMVFHTTDGGNTWEPCVCEGLSYHSLTMDGGFLTNQLGFIAVNSSQSPVLYVTLDQGATWQKAQFHDAPEYYTICYLPEWENGELVLYVSEEGYAKDAGVKARFVTQDNGLTWEFDGYALRG